MPFQLHAFPLKLLWMTPPIRLVFPSPQLDVSFTPFYARMYETGSLAIDRGPCYTNFHFLASYFNVDRLHVKIALTSLIRG